VSGHNKKAIYLVVLVVIAVVVGLTVWKSLSSSQFVTLRAGSVTYELTDATSLAQQEKGLGDRSSLPTNQGMLFSFSGSGVRCFWMKDMEFPLDIIWLSSTKQVVYIQSNALPSSYPKTFCPAASAQYVIELNSGQTKLKHIHIGQTLAF
jgi:uncharacterized membrane protein (UPF0127 family)